MSRVGKKPISIPKDVEVKSEGDSIIVKGPKGQLTRKIHPKVQLQIDGNNILVSVPDATVESRSLQGLFRVLVANMVKGVAEGFENVLEIVGVGYRAEMKGRTAVLSLGYSSPVQFELPEGIDAKIEKTKIILSGIDKELVGRTAAKIRALRKPEPYKGKGIKYADETIRRKAGKAGSTG